MHTSSLTAAQKASLFGSGAPTTSGPASRTSTQHSAKEQPAAAALLELEHSIGYNAKYTDTLRYHPTDKDTLVYPIGGLLVIENLHDKSKQ